jgi:hypothetical protein
VLAVPLPVSNSKVAGSRQCKFSGTDIYHLNICVISPFTAADTASVCFIPERYGVSSTSDATRCVAIAATNDESCFEIYCAQASCYINIFTLETYFRLKCNILYCLTALSLHVSAVYGHHQMFVYLPTLPTYLPTHLTIHLYLPTYLPTYLPIYNFFGPWPFFQFLDLLHSR